MAGNSGVSGRRIIGLTGNIACGKSLVLGMLGELGARTVDADVLAREAVAPGGPAYDAVRERFGPAIVLPSREIDRRRLGGIVFADRRALADLERLIHPHVRARLRALIDEADDALAVDAIKLIESGLSELCDEVWVVTCGRTLQLERLMARNGFTREEALLRIEAQGPQEDKVARADVVIENDGTREETRRRVVEAWEWR